MSTERAEKILSLQLEWVKAADAKVPPIFAINVAMLGVIVALMKALTSWTVGTAIFTALCLIPLALSIGLIALAMFPRLSGPKGSNVFFGGITKKAEAIYLEEVKTLSDEKYENDLLSQAYRNAEIAETKYAYVKLAFVSSFVSVPFWLVAIYLLYV
ncbi:MAG: hypothetical protein FVQ79_09870 [Planctomycetes bacterium]|nr:hypothetical protein [Planctomycetota bacterium]